MGFRNEPHVPKSPASAAVGHLHSNVKNRPRLSNRGQQGFIRIHGFGFLKPAVHVDVFLVIAAGENKNLLSRHGDISDFGGKPEGGAVPGVFVLPFPTIAGVHRIPGRIIEIGAVGVVGAHEFPLKTGNFHPVSRVENSKL